MIKARKAARYKSIAIQLLYVALGIVVSLPIIYAFFTSFLKPADILTYPPRLFPNYIYMQNYYDALQMTQLLRFILNSLIIAVVASFFRIVIGSLAAYAFAFFNFKGKQFLFFIVLGTMMIHPDTVIVTNYLTVSRMGLVNTYSGMVIIFLVSAFNIFMMRQYFMTVSHELRDAAYVDGVGNFTFFYKILMPLSKPVLAVVFISSFINMWNQYMWPLLVTNRDEMRPVQVGITLLNYAEGVMYGPTMAATIIVLIPSIFIFLIFRKQLMGDISAGALKG
ncbi:carbohydrate ABC transporter permease [Paenibacillus crassostreae]|uniref:ABC transporter permease n=1 Tax=Paenibacillus crassostreae TaxID=1763538 RepID=A0A167BF05_9BACL|nr:carbohydrate ABC transporter permease [Paenibacillus crassostreae]AOZ92899.1 ABC transporter permease [Paenibacillus crassostreae]OAB72012.1 ABC transporter permease [Paenibacillus crassostreae]